MEFKEILSYTKKWWWLVLVLSLLGGFGSFYLYEKLPHKRSAATWSARARFETPRDNLRVVSIGDNVLRVRVDINSEKFAIHSDANRETAAHYYTLIKTHANQQAAEYFESEAYRSYLKKLEKIAGEPLDEGLSYYNVQVLDAKDEASRKDMPFKRQELQDELKVAKDLMKGLKIAADSISNTRVVEITVAGAASKNEARLWADATVLASVRESYGRHIQNFREQIAREERLYKARNATPSEQELFRLEESARLRLEAREKLTPLDPSIDRAALRKSGVKPIPAPSFHETNADKLRLAYYSELQKQIDAVAQDSDGDDRDYSALVRDLDIGHAWDDELNADIRRLEIRINRLLDLKFEPERDLYGIIPFEEELLISERAKYDAVLASADSKALIDYVPNPELLNSNEIRVSRRNIKNLKRERAERLQSRTEADQGIKRIDADLDLELQNWQRVIEEAFTAKALALKTHRVRAQAGVDKINEELIGRRLALDSAQHIRRRYKDVAILYTESKRNISAANSRLEVEAQKIKGFKAGLLEQTAVLRAEAFSANAREFKASDNRLQVSIIVGLIILVGSSVMIYVMMLARNKIANEYDVRRHVNLPVLAKMGKRPDGEGSLLTISPRSAAAEAYSTLATQVRSYARELSLRSLLVTSAVKSEGKTDVTCNLSIALARKGLSVLVIDADLHRPRVANFFGVTATQGLMHYAQAPEDRDVIDYVMPTYAGGPDLLLPGGEVQDPVRLLESDAFKAMLKQAEREYDIVLFDSPPVARVGDALIVGSETDATLMVCCAGAVTFADAALAKRLLTNIQANLLGVVLNNSQDISAREYYNYYSYGDRTRRSVRKVFD